ncbi:hypothetical protein ACFYRJ_26125 [Streptomyces sp. NPDC005531]|uniref:hypothetical protein n=1 Tax=Streptomyces sp. NPDC005531 TaxID=3364722 RepID=UPI0036B283B2
MTTDAMAHERNGGHRQRQVLGPIRRSDTDGSISYRDICPCLLTSWKKEDNEPEIDLNRLAAVLRKKTVRQWKTDAVRATPSGGGSASRSQPLAENIVTAYNIGFTDTSQVILALVRGPSA